MDADKTNTGTDGVFLLSEELLGEGESGEIAFEATTNNDNDGQIKPNYWQNSDAQKWCKGFGTTKYFNQKEIDAMIAVSKEDKAVRGLFMSIFASSSLKNEKVFFISAQELADYISNQDNYGLDYEVPGMKANFHGKSGNWWLRSRRGDADTTYVGIIQGNGCVHYGDVDFAAAARPALNLDKSAILFTSSVDNGKTSGVSVLNVLNKVSNCEGNEFKLTLLDKSRNLQILENEPLSAAKGQSVTINYKGSKSGSNEYVSAIICDGDANVLYYGNVAQNSESGSAIIEIPQELSEGEYVLKVFSEQCNGGKNTDYASAFVDIPLTVLSAPELAGPTVEKIEGNTVILVNEGKYEYSADGIKWQTSNIFENLKYDKIFSFVRRNVPTSENPKPSTSYATKVLIPSAPEIALIGSTRVTVKIQEGYEYSINGIDWQNTNEFSKLTPNTHYEIYKRYADKTVNSIVSEPSEFVTYNVGNDQVSTTAVDLAKVRKAMLNGEKIWHMITIMTVFLM